MTPKEKADELCRKMLFEIEWNAQPSIVKVVAKKCALIAVDEIIEQNNLWINQTGKGTNNYWKEVKQEIEKL